MPLRGCLLSGGASRRMGRDKALLSHPDGSTWLEHQLTLLADLGMPVTLLSCHGRHLELAQALQTTATITALAEPAPWQGPLLALHRLMEWHPDQGLLLMPVDMPGLHAAALKPLLAAAAAQPRCLHLAHDGQRLQPLLGYYPSLEPVRRGLARSIISGERRLQSWLRLQPHQTVILEAEAIRNINSPQELDDPAAGSGGHARPEELQRRHQHHQGQQPSQQYP